MRIFQNESSNVSFKGSDNDFAYKTQVLISHQQAKRSIDYAFQSGLSKEAVCSALSSVSALVSLISPFMDKHLVYYYGTVKDGQILKKGQRHILLDYIKDLYDGSMDINLRVKAMFECQRVYEDMPSFFPAMGIAPISSVIAEGITPKRPNNKPIRKVKRVDKASTERHSNILKIVDFDIHTNSDNNDS